MFFGDYRTTFTQPRLAATHERCQPHTRMRQASAPLHIWPVQHGCPAAPHCAQTALPPSPLQTSDAPVHIIPAQQGWPAPPHMPQVPPWVQASPIVQLPPEQQGCPDPPHVAHMPLSVQPRPAAQESPAQQAWPAAPHAPHTWSAVHIPLAHASPAQHG
jgi:hypothetical protein